MLNIINGRCTRIIFLRFEYWFFLRAPVRSGANSLFLGYVSTFCWIWFAQWLAMGSSPHGALVVALLPGQLHPDQIKMNILVMIFFSFTGISERTASGCYANTWSWLVLHEDTALNMQSPGSTQRPEQTLNFERSSNVKTMLITLCIDFTYLLCVHALELVRFTAGKEIYDHSGEFCWM